jgi:hypothetical protein
MTLPSLSAIVASLVGALACAAAAAQVQLYQVSTETGMPHLEENLRYAVRHEQRCLDPQDLSGAFWMLGEVSLQDCRLVKADADTDAATYALQCVGGHGTSGEARWHFEPARLTGTLRVRLGGKNMTFYQRIVAKPLGPCL